MNTPPPTSKALLTGLYTIYYTLIMVMVLLGAVVFYLNYSGRNSPEQDEGFSKLLQYVLYILLPGGIGAGHLVYKQQLSSVDPQAALRDKLVKLQAAMLIRSACIEIPGMLGVVAAMVIGNSLFLLATGISALVFIFWRPTIFTITDDLQLSQEEKSILEDPEASIN